METDKIETLCKYADVISYNLHRIVSTLDESLDIRDIKSPYTLIGVDVKKHTYIIMRGYKIKSLINRYLKIGYVLRTFFIIDCKYTDLYHYRLEVENVSSKYII